MREEYHPQCGRDRNGPEVRSHDEEFVNKLFSDVLDIGTDIIGIACLGRKRDNEGPHRVGNSLLLGHCPFSLDVTLILRAVRPVGRAPRPPFIQALGHQGQFKNRNNTANLTTIQYNICLFLHVI